MNGNGTIKGTSKVGNTFKKMLSTCPMEVYETITIEHSQPITKTRLLHMVDVL